MANCSGHAFVGVETQEDSGYVHVIETTMLGTNTFEEAQAYGYDEYDFYLSTGELYSYNIEYLRGMDYLPRPSISTNCEFGG